MDQFVESHPDVVSGALVFVGTRLPVQTICDFVEGGHDDATIMRCYPTLKPEWLAAVRARYWESHR